MTDELLRVEGLVTTFKTDRGTVAAVDQISFAIKRGQTVGLVGESGCGKSVTSLSLLRLIDSPPGAIAGGKICFEGRDLLELSEAEMRKIRGNEISMIFQEPMTSLNPVYTIGNQIAEVFRVHQGADRATARKQAIAMLQLVNMPAPEQRVDEYPHQLSGGMRQRVMIAMALACQPKLLIADEPTTALDVTIQAQILALMNRLQTQLGMAILLITHDLGVVAEVCDYVVVMYAGEIVEQAPVAEIFQAPKHPYTRGLLNSIPRLGKKVAILPSIAGMVPSLGQLPPGCRFNDRCSNAMDICKTSRPPTAVFGPDHKANCWLYHNQKA